ncbi:MAG: class I SAM-dependent methyltransferase [Thermomicrobiales bacterium]
MEDSKPGLLGDTPARSYGGKLERYERFLEPELRAIIAGLGIEPGFHILDAGCGVGLVTRWLAETTGRAGSVVGVDLSHKHIEYAQQLNSSRDLSLRYMQGDITKPIFGGGTFDLIWTHNTINHLDEPVPALEILGRSLVSDGKLVLIQDLLLPEMIFAWDERLEQAVVQACRAYYRDRYGLTHEQITNQRNIFGWMQRAGYRDITVRSIVVERTPPLTETDIAYFQHSVFEGHWGEKVRPYLSEQDWKQLGRLTAPHSEEYALNRPDFHALQTMTIVTGISD